MGRSSFGIIAILFLLALAGHSFAASCTSVYQSWVSFSGQVLGGSAATCDEPQYPCGQGYEMSYVGKLECFSDCMNRGYGHPERHCNLQCCTKCGADSLNCNGIWNSAECKCSDGCAQERAACEARGGTFHGAFSQSEQCCAGECDLCSSGAVTQTVERYKSICCAAGLAFPDVGSVCSSTGDIGPCSIDVSTVCTPDAPCDCVGPEDAGFTLLRAQCNSPGSSNSGGSSSSGGGSSSDNGGSSGGGGSSGNGNDWEYDYNDSLHKIIVNTAATTDGIQDVISCFVMGMCKDDLDETNRKIQSVGDSIGRMRDTYKDSVHKIIELLGQAVNSPNNTDTIVGAISSASGDIVDAVEAQTTQVGVYIQGVADLIGVSTDSLAAHLDSIWRSLKPDIQDSILKYQRYADENFDSILYGKGKGFSLIDSMIDSTVKYFNSLISALDTLSVEVGLDSGAFSTDTTINPTIRNIDSMLFSIKDTSLYNIWSEIQYLGDTVNTLKPFITALGDSLGGLKGSVTGAIDGLGDSIGSLKGVAKSIGDSVSKYGQGIAAVGDSVGGVRGAVNGLGDSMSGWWNGNGKGGLDTSGNGVGGAGLDSILNGTSLYGDSAGVSHIVNAGINDTSLHYGPGGVFDTSGIYAGGSDVDTTGDDTLYALPSIDSVKAALERSIQEDYDSAEIKYRAYFDTLKDEMQLINWDSVILSPLAAKVPNTNTCPDDCFAVTSTGAPGILGNFSYNFGLCTSWPVLGGMNVLSFIRLILRIVTAVTCVYIGAWFIAGKK